jgi:hypothetical protein
MESIEYRNAKSQAATARSPVWRLIDSLKMESLGSYVSNW